MLARRSLIVTTITILLSTLAAAQHQYLIPN